MIGVARVPSGHRALILLSLFFALGGCRGPLAVYTVAVSPGQQSLSPLFMAAKTADVAAAERLLAAGADVNAQDKYHQTPLVIAVANGHRDMVEFLLAHGANVNQPQCRECLGFNGATPQAAICVLCWTERVDMATLLLAHGADVEAHMGSGLNWDRTALHTAAGLGNETLAGLYLAHGANVNSKAAMGGGTPLFVAVGADDKDMARFLIEHGADVNAREVFGRTPLYEVRSGSMAALLIEYGADVSVSDRYGQTPLQAILASQRRLSGCAAPECRAKGKSYQEAVGILVEHGAK